MARSKKVPISDVSKIWGENVDVFYEWSQKLQTQIYVYHEISCKEPKSRLIFGQFKNKSWKVPFFALFSSFFFFFFFFFFFYVENYASKECPKKDLILSCLKMILELISQTVWHHFIQRVVTAG